MFNLWNCCRLCLSSDANSLKINCTDCPELKEKIFESFGVMVSTFQQKTCYTKNVN